MNGTKEHVHINIIIQKRDQRGKAKERPKEKEQILKVLLVVAKKVVAKAKVKMVVDPLLQTVINVLGLQVLKVGMSTVYVDAFLMESMYRTKLGNSH